MKLTCLLKFRAKSIGSFLPSSINANGTCRFVDSRLCGRLIYRKIITVRKTVNTAKKKNLTRLITFRLIISNDSLSYLIRSLTLINTVYQEYFSSIVSTEKNMFIGVHRMRNGRPNVTCRRNRQR